MSSSIFWNILAGFRSIYLILLNRASVIVLFRLRMYLKTLNNIVLMEESTVHVYSIYVHKTKFHSKLRTERYI
jgi:hypothetical protein